MGSLLIGICIGFAAKRIIRYSIRLVRKTGLDKKLKAFYQESTKDL